MYIVRHTRKPVPLDINIDKYTNRKKKEYSDSKSLLWLLNSNYIKTDMLILDLLFKPWLMSISLFVMWGKDEIMVEPQFLFYILFLQHRNKDRKYKSSD